MARKINVHVNGDRCKGCAFCVSVCPRKILQLSDILNSKGYHYLRVVDVKKCTGCMFCAIMCPEIAIEIEAEYPK